MVLFLAYLPLLPVFRAHEGSLSSLPLQAHSFRLVLLILWMLFIERLCWSFSDLANKMRKSFAHCAPPNKFILVINLMSPV